MPVTNADAIRNMALSDLLKKINGELQWRTNYTQCVILNIDKLHECPGMNDCNKCIESWVNKPYKGGF